METRLIVAYLLIALMVAAGIIIGLVIARNRRERRRIMRGGRAYLRTSIR